MPDLMNYACGLAEDIGPRPANSEEEHQAALKIADWFKDRNVPVAVEEFNCPTWTTWPALVSFVLMIVAALLAGFTSHRIIMLIIAIVALALFVYERYLGGNIADKAKNGVSQNVVARYVPENIGNEKRRRKIIIVAHYDTERTSLEASPSLITSYPSLQKILLICMILVPVLILTQIFLPDTIRKWVWLFSCFVLLGPLVASINLLFHRFFLPYNDGANNNASGVAAMMGVFNSIVPGDLPDRPHATERPVVHDEESARDAGVVDEGTRISYEAEPSRQAEPPRQEEWGGEGRRPAPSRVSAPVARAAGDRPKPERPLRTGEKEIDAAAMLSDVKEAAGYVEQDVAPAAEAPTTPEAQPKVATAPVRRTAGTGDVMPKRKSAADRMAERRQAQPVRPSADVPDWWKKVEGNRKKEVTPAAGEAVKGRSQYADVPTMTYHRPEPEPEPEAKLPLDNAAETPAENPMVAQDAIDALEKVIAHEEYEQEVSEREVPVRPAPQATMPFTPVAPGAEADSEPARYEEQRRPEPEQRRPEPEQRRPEPEQRRPEPEERRRPEVSDERRAQIEHLAQIDALNAGGRGSAEQAHASNANPRLANLPKVETRPSGKTTPGKPVSLINDDAFGAPQVAPVSGDFRATPQNPDFVEAAAPQSRPGDTGSITSGSGELFRAGTFAAGETGAFIPVSDVSYDGGPNDDMIVADADDSSIGTIPTVGDFDAPASIAIPESRTHRLMDNMSDFFSRGKKKQQRQQEKSASDWLGVEEDYNPTEAGRQIGSWDNFDDNNDDDNGWKGGAVEYPDQVDEGDTQAFDLRQDVEVKAISDLLDKEVWFVALGAHGAGNAGMKDFIARHAHDLNASMFINIDSVGAGEICYLDREGIGHGFSSDHRLQSMARKTAREIGGNIEVESLKWTTTDATPALRAGLRAITFMGFDRIAPVAWNQKGDDCSVLEPSRLELTADVITEIVQMS